MMKSLVVGTLAVVLGIGLVTADPGPADAAGECERTAEADLDNRALRGTATRDCPDGGSSGSGVAYGVLWARWCGGAGLGVFQGEDVNSYSFVRLGSADGVEDESVTVVGVGGDDGAVQAGRGSSVLVPVGGRYGRYRVTCTADGQTRFLIRVMFDGSDPLSPFGLRDELVARIVMPDPVLGGSPSLDESFSIVWDPTIFWVENWQDEITDSESRSGMSVSVTARAAGVSWDPGDGNDPVFCPDGGRVREPGEPVAEFDCAHVYTRSTAGLDDDALTITATVEWELSWTLDGVDQGVFATYEAVTEMPHQVGEFLVVNS